MSNLEQKVPLNIKLKGIFYHIIDYKKKYGRDDSTINLADGRIEKFNFAGGESRLGIGEEAIKMVFENGMEYSTIWVHLGESYFKQISKTYEDRKC